MKFLLAKKVNMTQVFDESGTAYPVTILQSGPMTVTQVKENARDGYKAVQVSFGEKKEKNITKPLKGHMKGVNASVLKEYRPKDGEELPNLGDKIGMDIFAEGDMVNVSSVSKGKGFQGVVKRHGFKGGRRSHGQKHSEREPGSIGIGGVQKVQKGMRMGGRMGGDRVTVKNLKIIKILPDTGELMVRGAVPGRKGTLVEIKGN